MKWQVQEAKQKFSEVVQRTLDEGPQIVTRRGKDVVVMVSVDEWERLNGSRPSFTEVLLSMPKSDEFVEIMEKVVAERKLDYGRPIDP